MGKVVIISDSTCDLSKELIEKYDVKLIPLHVVFPDGTTYEDGQNIDLPTLFKKVEGQDVLPTTAAASPAEFTEMFKKYIDEGYDILYTGISSKLSCTFQNAHIAREEFPEGRIELVDSQNLSTGIGLLVIKACEYRDQGLNIHEIAEKLNNIVPRVKSQFVINTLEFLHKGGRCSGLIKFIGTAMKMKPMIAVREGSMSVAGFAMGAYKKALALLVKKFNKHYEKIDKTHVFITHAEAHEEAEHIRSELQKRDLNVKNLYETSAGCVIGTHCGPRCIGILYIVEE